MSKSYIHIVHPVPCYTWSINRLLCITYATHNIQFWWQALSTICIFTYFNTYLTITRYFANFQNATKNIQINYYITCGTAVCNYLLHSSHALVPLVSHHSRKVFEFISHICNKLVDIVEGVENYLHQLSDIFQRNWNTWKPWTNFIQIHL